MLYPNFIKENETVGVCAPSAGVGRKLEDFDHSLAVLKRHYRIKETDSVRINDVRSGDGPTRAKEFHELLKDEEVKLIAFAAGGDYMLEMLGDVDFEEARRHPKWLMGASDPTNLLYPVTTLLDIATLYGFNAGAYGNVENRWERESLEIIKGNLLEQKSYDFYRTFLDDIEGNEVYHPVVWKSNKPIDIEGRLIGGCFDVIANLLGTGFDGFKQFSERYREEGIIWYFDNFAKNAYDFYLILLQMKYAGYFNDCSGVLIGRHAFPNEENMTYLEALNRALGDIPFAYDLDIGHTAPCMTLINGSYAKVQVSDGKGVIRQFLK